MYHSTPAYRLALLVAALALAGPTGAKAQTAVDAYLRLIGPEEVNRVLGLDEDGRRSHFHEFSWLEITYADLDENDQPQAARSQFVEIRNNTDDGAGLLLRRDIHAVICGGSVQVFATRTAVACDGSVRELDLTISATLNPSIALSGTYNDFSLNGDPSFGVIATTGLGIPGFAPGSWLEGVFELTSIFPQALRGGADGFTVVDPPKPALNVTVREAPLRDYYIFGMVDLGWVLDPDDAILRRTVSGDTAIPQGTLRTDFTSLPSAPFQCIQCNSGSAGVGFASPGQGNGVVGGTQTTFAVTFRVNEVPPPGVIPLPAAGWLLLGGLGALAAVGRRRRRAA